MTFGDISPAEPPEAAPIFAALGDPYRLAIVERLCAGGPLPTATLSRVGKSVSRQGLTKHLHVLEDAGLVESFRVGRDRHWQVRRERIGDVKAQLDRLEAAWDARLGRLRAFVEEGEGA